MCQKKVAIQGGSGSFHEQAANHYFKNENIDFAYCKTFDELFLSLKSGKVSHAVLAIENTVTGSLLQNYILLDDANCFVVGEVSLQINQNLLVLPGMEIEDIDEVFSHPIAIAQTKPFFSKYPHIKLTPSFDTAFSAKSIWQNQSASKGAIASETSAINYGLDVLHRNIQSAEVNTTRFLVVSSKEESCDNPSKASIWFTVKNTLGSLVQILNILSENEVSVSKIQSFPIPNKEWEYKYFADLEIDNCRMYRNAIKEIISVADTAGVFGEFAKGGKYVSI